MDFVLTNLLKPIIFIAPNNVIFDWEENISVILMPEFYFSLSQIFFADVSLTHFVFADVSLIGIHPERH